jgi:predicted O-methyltransferase YrrM
VRYARRAVDLLRLQREARRLHDPNLALGAPWDDVAAILALARGARVVVEIGTGNAFTSILLARQFPRARIVTIDPIEHRHRGRYVELMGVVESVEFWRRRGDEGPDELMGIDLVFIDSSHEREDTLSEFRAWEPAVRHGGVVAFHDYGAGWPGVDAAIAELGLSGRVVGRSVFAWRKR